jgi:hypothetical protein
MRDDPTDAAFAEGLRGLADLAGAWTPPRLLPVMLREHTERLSDAAAVRDALTGFAMQPGCVGWLETPQELHAVGPQAAPPAGGTLLHAELACGQVSLQLRWADGAWLLTHQHENHPQGQACWAFDVERVAALPGVARWHYRVYLHADADGVLRTGGARLCAADA